MDEKFKDALAALRKAKWAVKLAKRKLDIPKAITSRYPWVPQSLLEFIQETEAVNSRDEKCWFLTAIDYRGEADSAFAWDEWEKQSLEAAQDDEDWKSQIREFWDEHFPFFLSLRNGYEYLALTKEGLAVVSGREPEFEETSPVADSLDDFLRAVALRGPSVAGWL